jgi:hypothetical protein
MYRKIPSTSLTYLYDILCRHFSLYSHIGNNKSKCIYYIYFREYEDAINLMCHVYEPNLSIGQHYINSKTWDLLLNVRFYDDNNIDCDCTTLNINL